jgi:hypothetical protein
MTVTVRAQAPAKAPGVAEDYKTPSLIVPYAVTKPVIDGVVNDEEWQGAVSVNALQSVGKQVSTRQTRFWIAWDEDNLYVAMRSPLRQGERPIQALRDRNTDINVVFDDAYELFFDVGTRSKDGQPCFFQFLANFDGTRRDIMFEPAVGNSRLGYVSGWEPQNRITPDGKAWEMEVAVPRASLFMTEPFKDGMVIRSLFARDFKRPWEQNSFEGTSNFSQKETYTALTLSKNAPALHLLGVADVAKGSLGVSLAGFSPAGAALKWSFESDGGAKKDGELKLEAGKVTAAAPALDLDPIADDKPADGSFRVRVTSADGKTTYLDWCAKRAFAGKRDVAGQAINDKGDVVGLSLDLNPVADYLKVTGDFIQYDNRAAIAKCRVTVSGAGKTLVEKEFVLDADAYVKGVLAMGKLEPGSYTAKLVCLDKDGKTVLERESVCEKKDPAKAFAWWNTAAGNAEKVLDPWMPVKVAGDTFEFWGRTMTIGPAGLPAQVVSQGRELLAEPCALVAELQDGTTVQAGKAKVNPVSAAHHRAVAQAESDAGDLKVKTTVTAEYDGMYRVDMTLTPSKPMEVKSLKVVIPVKNEEAEYIHATGEGIRYGFHYGYVPRDKTGRLWDSRSVDGQPLTVGSFIPMVYVGNSKAGLCWFANSDEGWNPNNDVPALELTRAGKGRSVDLVLNLVSAPATLDKPRTIVFAFMGTPVKKMHAQWRMDRWWCGSTFKDYSCTAPQGGNIIWHSIPYTLNESNCQKMVEGIHRGSSTNGPMDPAVPYWEYNSIGYFASEGGYFKEHWRLSDEEGFWFDKTFTDFIVHNLHHWAKATGIDGWYLDNTRPVACAKTEAGRGYRLADGRIQPVFSTFETRLFYLRLRAAFLEAGRQPKIVAHMTNNYMPPWCWDIAYDGEINIIYPESGKDFMDLWTLERLRLGYPGQWGVAVNFMQEYQGDWDKHPERYQKALRAFIGMVAIHDAIPSGNILWMPCYRTFLQARQAFGMGADDVVFHAYWDADNGVKAGGKDVIPAVWTRPGKALLLLANLGEQANAVVTLDPKALGLGEPATWIVADGEAGGRTVVTGADGKFAIVEKWDPATAPIRHDGKGRLTVPIERHDYRQILIEAGAAK